MKIRLDQVDKPLDWQETLAITTTDLDRPDVVDLSDVQCRGRVSPVAEGFLLQATLSYEQKLRCVRCLSLVSNAVSARVDFLIQIGSSEAKNELPEEEHQIREEELGLLTQRNPSFETRPIILEQVQLGVPMKVLCKEDCAGLCVSCGGDLNEGSCECDKATDPRWGALAGLKTELPD